MIAHARHFSGSIPFVRYTLRSVLILAWLGCSASSYGQSPTPEEIKQNRERLEQLQKELNSTSINADELEKALKRLQKEKAELDARMLRTTANVQKLEGAIYDSERRLGELEAEQDVLKQSLKQEELVIAQVLGALQRLGRNPPPAIIVQPNDVLSAVRGAILMGAVVPELRDKALLIAADLQKLQNVGKAIAQERDSLSKQKIILLAEQDDLGKLLDAREKTLQITSQDYEKAQQKASQLAQNASSLKDLIIKLEQDAAIARARAEAQRQLERSSGSNSMAALNSPGRMNAQTAFARLKGQLSVPVAGQFMTGFGDDDGLGGRTKGQTLQTVPNATITSPTEGWVIYAGQFRSYGEIVILDVGTGHHILMAGMQRAVANTGQFVLAGEPIAQMGTQSAAIAGLGFSAAQSKPILYIEFRRNGTSIDPAPWWSTKQGRVSG